MSGLTILVPGAGSPTGHALCRSLTERGHTVIAADPSPYATGKAFAARTMPWPWSTDAEAVAQAYIDTDADAAAVTLTAEIPIARWAGVPMWAASDESIEACEDKRLFALMCAGAGIPHPHTDTVPPIETGDYIVKPVRGEGSRNTLRVHSPEAVAVLLREFGEQMLWQETLAGTEWEADVFADAGDLLGGVAFWKHRIKGGTTMQAETFRLDDVAGILQATIRAFDLDGPLNIGGFWTATGPVMLEVNPRFSHGYLIAEAAGANPIEFWTRWIMGEPLDTDLLDCRPGVRFDRYYRHTVRTADPRHAPGTHPGPGPGETA